MKRSVGQIPLFIILALVVLTLFGTRTISTQKIWSHIATGQAMTSNSTLLTESMDPSCFTTTGETWISTTPLYDRLMFSMAKAPAAITLTHLIIILGAFILLIPVAKKWGNSLSQATALFLGAIMLVPMLNPSPIFFGMFFYALFLFLLRPNIKKSIRWAFLIPAQILWANIHPSFILGPIICLLIAIQTAVQTKGIRQNCSAKELYGLSLASLLVTILNPEGIKLHLYLIQNVHSLMLPTTTVFISPFSAHFTQPTMRQLLTVSLFLGAGGLITLKKRLPLALTTLAIVSAFFMMRSLHFTVPFVFLSFPFLVLSLQAIGEAIYQSIEPLMGTKAHLPKHIAQGLLVLFCLCAAWSTISNSSYSKMGSASKFGLGFQDKAIPSGINEIVNHPSFPEKVLNLPFDGAYLSYAFPNKQFYCDQRGDLFDSERYKTLIPALMGDKEIWQEIQRQYHPQAIILNCFSNESAYILRTFLRRKWSLCYFNGSYAILVSPSKQHEPLLKLTKAKDQGLQSLENELKRYSRSGNGIIKPTNSPQLIGAGNAFIALNRFSEAHAIYSTLLNSNPSMHTAWLSYGQALLGLKKLEPSIQALKQATQLMPTNKYALRTLQQAYKLAGDNEMADRIEQRLEKQAE